MGGRIHGAGKWMALLILVGALGWGTWALWKTLTNRNEAVGSSIVTMQTYRCLACGTEFKMDWAERRRMEAAGKVVTAEGRPARLPCPACGKVEAQLKLEAGPDDQARPR